MNWLCVFFGPHAVQGSGTWDVVNSLIRGTCSMVQIIREASGINWVWFLQLFYVLFECHNETVWQGDRRGARTCLIVVFPFLQLVRTCGTFGIACCNTIFAACVMYSYIIVCKFLYAWNTWMTYCILITQSEINTGVNLTFHVQCDGWTGSNMKCNFWLHFILKVHFWY